MTDVCPICGGKLIEVESGVICDTCDYLVDNEGREFSFGHELLHDNKEQ